MNSTLRPSRPPFWLTSSTQMRSATSAAWPPAPSEPVCGMLMPILTAPCCARTGPTPPASASAPTDEIHFRLDTFIASSLLSHCNHTIAAIAGRLVDHHAADRLAGVHQVEGAVDVRERQLVGDQVVDVELALHVPVDDARHVGAAACAAEGGALPYAAGDELEGARLDFLAGAGHADDHRHPPAAVAALERLAHEIHVADAFEAVIRAAACELHYLGNNVLALRVDEVGQAELARQRLARGVEVDADDHVGAGDARALHYVEPDAAQTENRHLGPGLDLGGIDHRANAGCD